MSKYSFTKLINITETYELLAEFLETNHGLEMLNFVEQIHDFNLLISHRAKLTRAKTIFETFLKEGSRQEINIDFEVRKNTKTAFDDAISDKAPVDEVFREAYKAICWDLMLDVFPRFIIDKKTVNYFTQKRLQISPEKFAQDYCLSEEEAQDFIKEIDNYKAKHQKSVKINVDDIFEKHDAMELLSVKIDFKNEELDEIYASEELKPFGSKVIVNKMIVDMMKPFTGVQLSEKPKEKSKGSSFFSIFVGKKTEEKRLTQQKLFNLENFRTWIIHYYKMKIEEITIEKILELLLKYKCIDQLKSETGAKIDGYFKILLKKKVVIVGCGIGGMILAKNLRDDFDVTCIDRCDKFKFNASFYKLFSDPSHIKEVEFDQKNVICKGCNFISAQVRAVSPSAVYLMDKVIPFDYLYVSTGSSYYIPFDVNLQPFAPRFNRDIFEFNEQTKQKQIKVLTPYDPALAISHYADLREAKHVIVAGSGPVGIEIFGEIAHHYPNTKVTVLTQSGAIMDRQSTKAHKAAMKIIKSMKNLEIVFNASITKIEGTAVYYRNKTTEEKKKNIERKLDADIAILCLGLRPNTRIFKNFMSDSLSPLGFVKVNDYLEVQYGENYLGDKKLMEVLLQEHKKQQEDYLKQCEATSPDDIEDDLSLEESPEIHDRKALSRELSELYLTESTSDENATDEVKPGYPNIYAIGDIIDSGDEKLAQFARTQALCCVDNLFKKEFSLTRSEFLKNRKRHQSGKTVVQIINIGPKGLVMKGKKLYTHGGLAKSLKDAHEYQFANVIIPS
eukprot:gene2543-3505_t